jgi:hypothetical protein
MAKRGTKKWFSVNQEDYIARLFSGRRSASSGAAVTDAGDVRCPVLLIECKTVVPNPTKPKRPGWLKQFEKVAEEAWAEGREPMMAFRFYDSDSILSDSDGIIDLTVRIAKDDAMREEDYDSKI